ncbi:MAG: helix-turn-helix domain-containing protein [Eubacteriales bacterium]|nr:helix-turn-helix domain-containing protein [Eubacteriales bacterium]
MGEYNKSAIIRDTRILKGMTQEELSEFICDPVTLSRYERGKLEPTDEKFLLLMKKMGESGERFLCPVKCCEERITKLMEKLNGATERQDWACVENIKRQIELDEGFETDNPENIQYLKRIEIILRYHQGKISAESAIERLKEIWCLTVKGYEPQEFPENIILRETEVLILFHLATFYKIQEHYMEALQIYEKLDHYLDRTDANNNMKPVYLIYIGYSNLLGIMKKYEKSVAVCFKAINILLSNNQSNYLYNFYYNVAWNYVKQNEECGKNENYKEAKLYAWLALQLCRNYPEDHENLDKIRELYEGIA